MNREADKTVDNTVAVFKENIEKVLASNDITILTSFLDLWLENENVLLDFKDNDLLVFYLLLQVYKAEKNYQLPFVFARKKTFTELIAEYQTIKHLIWRLEYTDDPSSLQILSQQIREYPIWELYIKVIAHASLLNPELLIRKLHYES